MKPFIWALACWTSLSLTAIPTAHAQDTFPLKGKPISIVVPFAAGSGTDTVVRLLAEKMSKTLQVAVIVDNKPGANGQIGTEFVARSVPDGHTVLMGGNSTHSINPYLVKNLRYDAVKDFTPIGLATLGPLAMLVPVSSAAKTAMDIIREARERPGKLSYGYANTGGLISSGMFVRMAKLDATAVPYKAAPGMLTDLASGQIDFAFIDFAASRALIEANRVRAIASTARQRTAAAKDTPLLRELPIAGFESFEMGSWIGLFGPAHVPERAVNAIFDAMKAALAEPDVRQRLVNQLMQEIMPMPAAEFTVFLREQDDIYRRRMGEAGLKPE